MTKKSHARKMRDLQKKSQEGKALTEQEKDQLEIEKNQQELMKFYQENKGWDELENIFQKLAEQLATTYHSLIAIFSVPGIVEHLQQENNNETILKFKTIQKDFESVSNRLVEIHNLHLNKKGNIASSEEMTEILTIFEEYEKTRLIFDSLIAPNYADICTIAGSAAERLQKQQLEQDPNVITDVEVKESPNE